MAEGTSDKKGFTISLILLLVVAAIAILIFYLMLGRTTSVDSNKTATPGAFTSLSWRLD